MYKPNVYHWKYIDIYKCILSKSFCFYLSFSLSIISLYFLLSFYERNRNRSKKGPRKRLKTNPDSQEEREVEKYKIKLKQRVDDMLRYHEVYRHDVRCILGERGGI